MRGFRDREKGAGERSSRERKAQTLTTPVASRNYAKAGEGEMGVPLLGGGGDGFSLQA